MEIDFQMVSLRKAARRPSPAKHLSPVIVTNRYEKLDDTPAPREIRGFPGTTNKLLYGYINIQAASDDNKLQIVQLLTEKKEEFILLEATKDRPIKVVLKGLQAETDRADIVEDVRNKGFSINRISPMRYYKLQKPLDMFLIEVKKEGNFQNI
ncbi:hypothetical protein AVEN_242917-1 [Araneus ventricosus]|uniref:Pre-C2HC domain-containing protein n=1 Tax=Araneus ventricosus TaxID=182803 RepID=A0A4Y2K3P0_ARAVE|nr:hypothetical protein AVEN_242917-1 [Araneus ventricosus]